MVFSSSFLFLFIESLIASFKFLFVNKSFFGSNGDRLKGLIVYLEIALFSYVP